MLLLVGLGNPGAGYAGNRHNVGFMAVDEIVRRHGFGADQAKFQGRFATGTVAGTKVGVLKPETFMNESGRAVGAAMRFFKIDIGEVVVFHDDLDLAPGKVRIKTGGGHGGHNGLRSIDAHVGRDYRRVRLGIGHPGHKDRVTGYVLSDFAKAELPDIERMIEAVAAAADLLVAGDDGRFMNKVSLATRPPEAAKDGDAKNA